jgi:hypothetical protein
MTNTDPASTAPARHPRGTRVRIIGNADPVNLGRVGFIGTDQGGWYRVRVDDGAAVVFRHEDLEVLPEPTVSLVKAARPAAIPAIGSPRDIAARTALVALTPAQRQTLADVVLYDQHPGTGLHPARRQVLEARGLATSQRVGTGRGAWTRVELTELGADAGRIFLADVAAMDAAAEDTDDQRDQDAAMVELADEALTSGNVEPDVPVWERNLARLADGPAADRIAELEAQLQAEVNARNAAGNRIVELEAALEARNAERRELVDLMHEDDAVVDGLAAAARRLEAELGTVCRALDMHGTNANTAAMIVATRADSYRQARERITELEDERAPLRGAARDVVNVLRGPGGSDHIWACVDHLADVVGMLADEPAPEPAAELEPEPAMEDTRAALAAAGLVVPTLLDNEGAPIREYVPATDGGPRRVRVIGVLVRDGDAYRLHVADGKRGRCVIPPALVPAYVAAVRGAEFPPPVRRLQLRAQVLGMRESEPSAG